MTREPGQCTRNRFGLGLSYCLGFLGATLWLILKFDFMVVRSKRELRYCDFWLTLRSNREFVGEIWLVFRLVRPVQCPWAFLDRSMSEVVGFGVGN